MYLTRTQREGERERSSCWRRRVRQRRSWGGLSLLALQCEGCYVGGGRRKKGTRKEKSKQGSKAVCLVCEDSNVQLKGFFFCLIAGGLFSSLLFSPLLSAPVLHNHAAWVDTSLAPCSPAGANGAPGVRLRLPASPL